MIEYMLMNLGILAGTIGIKPEHVVSCAPVPDDSVPPKENLPSERPVGPVDPRRGLEGITIAECFYSPIRRTDFL